MDEEIRGKPRRVFQQGQEIRKRVGFDMGVAHQGVSVGMPHQSLHTGHRLAHLQAPGGEGMPQGMEGQRGTEGLEHQPDDLGKK